MSAAVTIDPTRFNNAIQRVIATSKKSSEQILRQQAALFVVDAAKLTPPNKNFKWNKKGGEQTILNDLNHILVGLSPNLFRQFVDLFGGKVMRRQLTTKDGRVFVSDRDELVTNIPGFHKSQRTRFGRVTKAGSYTRDIGRSRDHVRGVVPESSKKAYIKTALKRVGKLAAGWKAAAIKLGAKLPAWITRHDSAGYAKVETRGSVVSVELANASVYPRIMGTIERRLPVALRRRAGAMNRMVDRYLKLNARRAGFR